MHDGENDPERTDPFKCASIWFSLTDVPMFFAPHPCLTHAFLQTSTERNPETHVQVVVRRSPGGIPQLLSHLIVYPHVVLHCGNRMTLYLHALSQHIHLPWAHGNKVWWSPCTTATHCTCCGHPFLHICSACPLSFFLFLFADSSQSCSLSLRTCQPRPRHFSDCVHDLSILLKLDMALFYTFHII